MAILKCKMCGGNIEVGENQNIGVCDSCGSTMTIPNVNDERILNLFDRANQFRMQNEFDKALAAYESILSEDNKNAEAHWGCVLSRYGIEYVEDPKTHKRVPTCHRVQNESVLSDIDYKAAVEYTDDIAAKNLYQQEAEAIAEIQKNILSIANNEAPYDVFICYKETDNSGRRTIDSTLAQDIYYQLTNEGFKVFFSRITLEDKLGTEYEPYIFSALNSAKVMLVIGTSKDYFNAVWVKNEWARFLDLARKDKSKMIIPCYRDMDAYDLPDELSMFQSQDMGKIGFIQDLIRGIKKILQKNKDTESTVILNNKPETEQELLEKGYNLLEIRQFDDAVKFFNKIFEINPKCSKAHWGKLLCTLKVKNNEELINKPMVLDEKANNLGNMSQSHLSYENYVGTEEYQRTVQNNNPTLGLFTEYQNAIKYANDEEKTKLININKLLIAKRKEMYDINYTRALESQKEKNDLIEQSNNGSRARWWKVFGITLLVYGAIMLIVFVVSSLLD